ncbi:MAG: PBS lyase [Deltaproteobacteria bacterium RBG_13_43_22]|nr:MAG: PBS lyase [Deltaproteobacteria bacterium RBG_13_43_22]
MITKKEIIEKAYECGFGDIGFTTAEPFDAQKTLLQERRPSYEWVAKSGLDLWAGTDPRSILPLAKTIIVLIETYFNQAFPASMERYFGRCYQDDDRIIKNNLAKRTKAFRSYLTDNGIITKVPPHLPHRIAAARAGLGTFGKNCLFYSNKLVAKGSWVLPIALVVDQAFAPDDPTLDIGCPDWCKNTCLTACPTGALKGPRHIEPQKCISYLTYYGQGLTPRELREPMGLWVYGCDHCQNVCPRNKPWLARELPVNQKVAAMAEDFRLEKLLSMDIHYFKTRIWPHMFYMSENELWRWKMNVARVMGNTLDDQYIEVLAKVFDTENDERVLGMAAWALGRIGGPDAEKALKEIRYKSEGLVREEILSALQKT